MDDIQVNHPNPLELGEEWIQAVTGKDFQRLAGICQPDVTGRLMTPRRIRTPGNAIELSQAVEEWFIDCSSIETEQVRIGLVGKKLAVFYRLKLFENGTPYTAEQQLYCSIRAGRIAEVSLVCSGFQPDPAKEENLMLQPAGSPPATLSAADQPDLHVDALLEVGAAGETGSTCAILTPAIRRKLGEILSGQVLEVHVDDASAKEDIEAWCRLSGNRLLKMDRGAGQQLRFYLMKK